MFLKGDEPIARRKIKAAVAPGAEPATALKSTAGVSSTSDQAPQNLGWAPRLLLWSVVVLAAAALQWSDGTFLKRELIDYDDFEVIRPMLKLDWNGYWQEWFPDRTNYAFPLRDATHFFDQMLGKYFGFGMAWVTQFLFFAVSLWFLLGVFSGVLGPRMLWVALPFAILALHPLQTEALQWQTCRKYVVPGVFLAAAALLFTRWRQQPFSQARMTVFLLLWLTALLGYPTAALWMLWLVFAMWLWGHPWRRLWPWAVGSLVLSGVYLAYVGAGTGEVNAGLTSILSNTGKAWFFGSNALGRGFWNLLFPYWLAPYYNELSWRNTAGLALLVALVLLLVVRLSSLRSQNQGNHVGHNLRELVTWLSLGLVLIVPTANTILTFHDFMLADRHLYLSLPYFVLAGALVVRAACIKASVKATVVVGSAFVAWLVMSAKTTRDMVPRWRNSYTLMESCAMEEGSPRCHSQAIRRLFFKDKCNLTSHIIDSASQLYKSYKPRWSLEFRTEVPFFHASCLALSAKLKSDDKLQTIDGLHEFYGESPDVIFGLVLAQLERGNLAAALALASQYHMGKLDKGPILVTYSLLGVYRGQLEALCKLDPYGVCPAALKRFVELHPATADHQGSVGWGRAATEMMARRGGLM
jgi:hypothetical protein